MSTHAQAVPGVHRHARKQLIVNWGFQLRTLLPLLVFVALYVVLLIAVLFIPLHRSVADEPDLGVRAILRAQLFHIHLTLWPLLMVSLLFATYYAWRRSLRVAGPLYRLHLTLRELVEGEYRSIRFREGDEFRVFEDDVAQLSQKMRLIATRNRDILLTVYSQVKRLADRLEADDIIPRADLAEAVNAMRAQLEKAPEISLVARR